MNNNNEQHLCIVYWILTFKKQPVSKALMLKINLHTHYYTVGEHIQVLNVFAQDLPATVNGHFFSTGLHPWHIQSVNPDDCFHKIALAAKQINMMEVGECGLDRSKQQDFALQENYFREQIRIAEIYSKPLIIHAVRAFSDLIRIKKETKSDVPWIIHGYRGNRETTTSLTKQGFYFSVGESLLRNKNMPEYLQMVPPERLFFETDDQEISIHDVYTIASNALEIDEESLIEKIFINFTSIFGDSCLFLKI